MLVTCGTTQVQDSFLEAGYGFEIMAVNWVDQLTC